MKKVGILSAMALGTLAFLMVPMMSWAGGTVEGKVSFSGKPPAPKEFLFSKFPNPKFCVKNESKDAKGEKRLLREVEVGKALGQTGSAVALPYLLILLGDETPRPRIAAIRALGHVGTAKHITILRPILGDPDVAVRATAAGAIGRLLNGPQKSYDRP